MNTKQTALIGIVLLSAVASLIIIKFSSLTESESWHVPKSLLSLETRELKRDNPLSSNTDSLKRFISSKTSKVSSPAQSPSSSSSGGDIKNQPRMVLSKPNEAQQLKKSPPLATSKPTKAPPLITTTLKPLPPKKARMSFDENLIVTCKDTDYVVCRPETLFLANKPQISKKNFTIAVIRGSPMFTTSFKGFHKCVYTDCVGVGNDTKAADVVVVSGVGLTDEFPVPPRHKGQLYVIAGWEAPQLTYASFQIEPNSSWNVQFNLTMTHRRDSDIYVPYAKFLFQPKPLDKRPNYREIAQLKTKTAVWFVSNCWAPSERMEYVKEMQKIIDVDIYGNSTCGKPCSKNDPWCGKNFTSTYKFYLAFENSFCTDYVTEKVFKLFVPGVLIVPVVRGGIDYDNLFPEHTYINTDNFPTAKDLAQHLKCLSSDLEAYSRYLEYIDLYGKTPGGIGSPMRCELCKYLHTHKFERKVYDAKKWMSDGHCYTRNDIR